MFRPIWSSTPSSGAPSLTVHRISPSAPTASSRRLWSTAIFSSPTSFPKRIRRSQSRRRSASRRHPSGSSNPVGPPMANSLVFVSARNGNFDLFSITRADEDVAWTDSFEFTTKPIATGPENEQDPRFSPDGELIAFVRGKGQLVVARARRRKRNRAQRPLLPTDLQLVARRPVDRLRIRGPARELRDLHR